MYKIGDTAYIILNNKNITEVTISKINGNLYIVRFNNGGGIQVPKGRLFSTRELAEEYIKNHTVQPNQPSQTNPTQPINPAKPTKSIIDSMKYNAQLL